MDRCPGVGMEVSVRSCPRCAEDVEFLPLDLEGECPDCGKELYREADQSCVTWCDYSDTCIDDMLERGMVSPENAEKLRSAADGSKEEPWGDWESLL